MVNGCHPDRTWVESQPRRNGRSNCGEKDLKGNEGGIREGFSQKCEESDPSDYEQVKIEIRSPTYLANYRGISPSSLEQKLAKS